jgi:hypothetical protein
VHRAFNLLRKKGLLINLGDNKNSKLFVINPEAAYKGKANTKGNLLVKVITQNEESFFKSDFIEKKIQYLKDKEFPKGTLVKYWDDWCADQNRNS